GPVLVGEMHGPVATVAAFRTLSRRTAEHHFWQVRNVHAAQIDDFGRGPRLMAVDALVRCFEGLVERGKRVGGSEVEGYLDGVAQSDVANVGKYPPLARQTLDVLGLHQRVSARIELV